jgi:hypothetical protein
MKTKPLLEKLVSEPELVEAEVYMKEDVEQAILALNKEIDDKLKEFESQKKGNVEVLFNQITALMWFKKLIVETLGVV